MAKAAISEMPPDLFVAFDRCPSVDADLGNFVLPSASFSFISRREVPVVEAELMRMVEASDTNEERLCR